MIFYCLWTLYANAYYKWCWNRINDDDDDGRKIPLSRQQKWPGPFCGVCQPTNQLAMLLSFSCGSNWLQFLYLMSFFIIFMGNTMKLYSQNNEYFTEQFEKKKCKFERLCLHAKCRSNYLCERRKTVDKHDKKNWMPRDTYNAQLKLKCSSAERRTEKPALTTMHGMARHKQTIQ